MEQRVESEPMMRFDWGMTKVDAYALWCTSAGQSQIRHTPLSVGAGEELVEVIASDVSPLDRQVAEGRFPPGPPFPVIPGTTGIVRDANGLLYFAFVEIRGGGLFTPGIHRTKASISRDLMFAIPEEIDPIDVAAGFTGIITALAVIDHLIKIKSGQSILILGANGAVGAAAVQVALERGAHVIAVARNEISIPSVDYVSYDQMPEKVMGLTGGKGVDGIIDGLGGEISNKALMSGGADCKHVLLGFSAGVQMPLIAPRFLGNEHQLIGYNLLRRPLSLIQELMSQSMDFMIRGKVLPHIAQKVDFASAPDAFKTAAAQSGRTVLMIEGYEHD